VKARGPTGFGHPESIGKKMSDIMTFEEAGVPNKCSAFWIKNLPGTPGIPFSDW
jgi:hypothetical protein